MKQIRNRVKEFFMNLYFGVLSVRILWEESREE